MNKQLKNVFIPTYYKINSDFNEIKLFSSPSGSYKFTCVTGCLAYNVDKYITPLHNRPIAIQTRATDANVVIISWHVFK